MSVLPLLILLTTGIFLTWILVQSLTRIKFCAVCAAISSTWLMLLGAGQFGFTVNPTLIGVLMGESVVGLYYLLEKKVPPAWQLFRWPYLITMTIIVYLVVGIREGNSIAIIFLALLWVIYGGIYAFRQFPSVKKIAERLIACCRDW